MSDVLVPVRVNGVGAEIPTGRITNQQWEQIVETSDEWIRKNIGIKTRSRIEPERSTTDLGVAAAHKALAMAGVPAGAIDMILCATNSQEELFPSTASKIQAALDMPRASATDLQAGCTGWLYGMELGTAMVSSGQAQHVLVVGAEALSRAL